MRKEIFSHTYEEAYGRNYNASEKHLEDLIGTI